MRLRRFLGGLAVVAIAVTLVLLLLFRAEDGSGGDQPREDEPAPTAGDVGGGTPPLRGHAPNDARHPASRPQVTETFDVRVFGPDGSPLKDADVRVYAQDGAARHAGVTDAEGRVALPPLSPDTMYEVWAATRDLDLPWRLQVPGGTRTIELRLERIPSFRIRLVDEAGEVVDGTDVRVLRRDPDSFLIVARSRPSGDGGLTVRFRPEPGATYRLDRVNADSPPRADHIDPLTVAWDPSDGDVRIDRRHVVRGVVRSAAGAPLPGALIQHRWRPDLTEVTIADAQGAFTVGVSSVGRLGRYDDAELRVVLAGAEDRDAPWTHVRARTTDAVFIIDPGPYVVVRLPRPEELGESRALPLETVPPLGCEAALLPGDALTLAVPDSSTRYSMFVGPDAGGR
ncbi:MAG: carboxypeptidase-like regulatory domain-containing protein, partial [Planctomycetes bacterium]|nr:carboxypeptidase-like regulatory domain-containing protein [Planctomycetota bacterium]